jgi:PmbA protein
VNLREQFESLAARLAREGLEQVELYRKEGRSRRFESGGGGRRVALQAREQGWAVRAGSGRASLFAAGSGPFEPDAPLPAADGGALRLPPAAQPAPWPRPAELDAPLVNESEAGGLLERIGRRLADELPGARLTHSHLEEGVSTAWLISSQGIETEVQSRSAALLLEASWEGAGASEPASVSWYVPARTARGFSPSALALRLADRLLVRGRGGTIERDRGEAILAPAVVAAALDGLRPLLVGPEAGARARLLRDRAGRIGSAGLTVLDDGRYPGAPFEAPVDGEGVETRRMTLIEEGVFRQPLLSWREADRADRASGCVNRPGWRDAPTPGPTHLFLRPQATVSPGALLRGVARGFYLLDETAPGVFDFEADRFDLPVCGFALRSGRAAASFARARLTGAVSALLRGIQATARDLTFEPRGGRLGGVTALVSGLELQGTER